MTMTGVTTPEPMAMKDGHKMGDGKMKEMKEEIKKMKEAHKDLVKENRTKIKENIESFKSENGKPKDAFKGLTEDQKKEIKSLSETHKSEMKALQDSFKASEKTDENIQAHRTAVEALRAKHFDELKAVVGDNAEASAFVDARKSVFEENSQIREENTQARIEMRGAIEDKVMKYKEVFGKKIIDKLPKMPEDKLQKLLTKITTMIAKTTDNTKLKQENKDKLLAQLTSLKELIEEELDNRTSQADTINIDEIIQ